MDGWPADVIGLNCSVGPKATLETIERMVRVTTKPMSAMPNAGMPTRVEGRNIYLCSPEYMAQYARRLLWAGVKVIGGCCGTTPEHIKLIAVRDALAAAAAATSWPSPSMQPAGRGAGAHAGARRREVQARREAGRRHDSWRLSRFCRRAASTRRRKSPAPGSAPSTASTASTCRTVRAPAPA